MALTRTTQKWARVYMSGYDMSGYSRSVGPLDWTYDEVPIVALSDAVKGYLPGWPEITPTALNGIFDHTTSGLHDIAKGAGVSWVTSIALGMNAEPALGDSVYCGRFQQSAYQAQDESGAVVVSVPFVGGDAGNLQAYDIPWGKLIHAKGAETAANAGAGVDGLAASAFGGYMVYHVFAGDGTATIKVQKSTTTNTDGAFSDLSGATSGEIDFSTPTSGIIELSKTASIGRYLRWQLALNSATTVTFMLAFVRGTH